MFGSHLSIAGGMVNALIEAKRLKLDGVQVFTKNQRQWNVKPLAPEDRQAWLEQLKKMRWCSSDGPPRTVSHNSYLINLASPDTDTRNRSLALQREEVERCEQLDIPLLVAHPGAHLGAARDPKESNDLSGHPSKDELRGLKRIIKSLDRVHRQTAGYTTITCLETTVGSGTNLGYDFHHLATIREGVREPERVGFCIDTCHVTAAGYNMTTDARAAAVLEQFDSICGMQHVHVVHVNDSVGAVGSRKDRHAHIGKGTCGMACFRAIVNHPHLAGVPKILETPKETTPKGTPYDTLNVRKLRRLSKARGKGR